MSNRQLLLWGSGAFVLLLLAALWILLHPPNGRAAMAGKLSASNPALNLRYNYNAAIFKPAPYDAHAEFPLRLDAEDWSFYGKRLGGMRDLLVKEPQPVVYRFINEASTSVYGEFYRLEIDGKDNMEDVRIGGVEAVRQQLRLQRTAKSLGWPRYFPYSITAGESAPLIVPQANAERTFDLPDDLPPPPAGKERRAPSTLAWAYSWALFHGSDLFLFQAIAPRELTAKELAQAEALINGLQFDALQQSPQTEASE
jgi:hypothetical protein